MWENPVLLKNLHAIRDVLDNTAAFERVLLYLKCKDLIPVEDDDYFLKKDDILGIICSLTNTEFLNMIYIDQNPEFIKLDNLIEATWHKFLLKIKRFTMDKVSVQNKFPFWPKNPTQVCLKDIWISLTLENHSSSYPQKIDTTELFANLEGNKRVLVFGDPGMGKSYHMKKILYMWAKNELCNEKLLLPVTLSCVIEGESLLDSIVRENLQSVEKIDKDLIRYYLDTSKEQIFLLIDGYDEFSAKNSEIFDIVNGISGVDYSIIVWTRSWNVKKISKMYDIIVEIHGFNKKNKLKFFQSFFNEKNYTNYESKSLKLFKYLKNNRPLLLNFCNNPLIATITAAFWEKGQHNLAFDYVVIEEATKVVFEKAGIFLEEIIFYEIGKKCFEYVAFGDKIQKFNLIEQLQNRLKLIFSKNIELKDFSFINFLNYEFFAAKYLIELYERNEKNILEKLSYKIFNNKKILRLKYILEFVKQLNNSIFNKLTNNNVYSSYLDDIDDDLFKYLCCSQEREIFLKHINFSNNFLDLSMVNFGYNLNEIKLFNVFFNYKSFFNVFKSLLENNVKLFTMKYSTEYFIKKFDLYTEISKAFPSIEKLYIENVIDTTNPLNGCTNIYENLKSFVLKNSRIQKFHSRLSSKSFPKLKKLNFSYINFEGKCILKKKK